MKKVVVTFGLLSGGVSAALMFATLPFIDDIGFDRGAVISARASTSPRRRSTRP